MSCISGPRFQSMQREFFLSNVDWLAQPSHTSMENMPRASLDAFAELYTSTLFGTHNSGLLKLRPMPWQIPRLSILVD